MGSRDIQLWFILFLRNSWAALPTFIEKMYGIVRGRLLPNPSYPQIEVRLPPAIMAISDSLRGAPPFTQGGHTLRSGSMTPFNGLRISSQRAERINAFHTHTPEYGSFKCPFVNQVKPNKAA